MLPLQRCAGNGTFFMANLADAVCKKQNGEIGEWELCTRGQTYLCNDFLWTCTCLFYCSHHLPCQHLMYIAECVHRFECLPASKIVQRWDMMAMSEMETDFQAGVSSIQAVQTSMKVAGEAFTHDGLTQPQPTQQEAQLSSASDAEPYEATQEETHPEEGHATARGRTKMGGSRLRANRRVIYVKIRRRERANVVVLSAEEKYCYAKAVFEPVMEHLSGLASPAFCSALQVWRNIARNGLRQCADGGEPTTDTTACEDDATEESNASDTASDIAPANSLIP
ncbi:hypothetical protein V7S43_011346 [Phytophthora oleae]|uniref:SWIM-type domain-containing protein n=1 Tax=Phytophthora oleae TaxID=2107226 RepID=A0ABD3FBZ9_9STRA